MDSVLGRPISVVSCFVKLGGNEVLEASGNGPGSGQEFSESVALSFLSFFGMRYAAAGQLNLLTMLGFAGVLNCLDSFFVGVGLDFFLFLFGRISRTHDRHAFLVRPRVFLYLVMTVS